MKTARRKPTDAELAILRVLWARGPSTVRDVLESLQRDTGYTTALKLLQIMTEKGLVRRDERSRTHVYETTYTQDQTERTLVSDLLDRAFGGSAVGLMLYVEDVDATVETAVAEGAKVVHPVEDKFYGDRTGTIDDPFGHRWHVGTHKEDVPPDELKRRAAAMAKAS